MKEVNNLLKRLGELEDAPLIWINEKVYDMTGEIKRLNEYISYYEDLSKKQNKEIERLKESEEYHRKGFVVLGKRINEAIEFIEDNTYKSNETEYMDLTGIKEILSILKGVDKE